MEDAERPPQVSRVDTGNERGRSEVTDASTGLVDVASETSAEFGFYRLTGAPLGYVRWGWGAGAARSEPRPRCDPWERDLPAREQFRALIVGGEGVDNPRCSGDSARDPGGAGGMRRG